MADVIRKYGAVIDRLAPGHPTAARRMLLAGLVMFGAKLRFRPDRRLPKSRQQLAVMMNQTVVSTLAHSERTVVTSVFTPCELLYAAGLTPMCAELYSSFVNGAHAERRFAEAAEEEGVAESFCSYHKVLLGSACLRVFPRPKCIVNTSLLCDANQLTFRELSALYDVPQFYIDVPPRADEEAVAYVAAQFAACREFLEDVTGGAISEAALRERMERSKETLDALRTGARYKEERFLPGDIASELYEVYMAHNGLGSENALAYAMQFARDWESGGRIVAEMPGQERPVRLLWVHTLPNWQEPLRALINCSEKLQIISCDLNRGHLNIACDPAHPYESMARRLVYSAFNGPGERRVAASVEAAVRSRADGAVIFCHWGCKQTMGIAQTMQAAFDEAGVPALILNGDGCDERGASDGQVETRMDAFLEMIRARGGRTAESR